MNQDPTPLSIAQQHLADLKRQHEIMLADHAARESESWELIMAGEKSVQVELEKLEGNKPV